MSSNSSQCILKNIYIKYTVENGQGCASVNKKEKPELIRNENIFKDHITHLYYRILNACLME